MTKYRPTSKLTTFFSTCYGYVQYVPERHGLREDISTEVTAYKLTDTVLTCINKIYI
jgi:hypothetical protein